MEKNKFDQFWSAIVTDLFNKLNYENNDCFHLDQAKKKKVYELYEKKKNYIRNNYMENPNAKIDRHKVASSLMYAIVMVKPVTIKKDVIRDAHSAKRVLPAKHYLINEYLGFYCALSVIQSFMNAENSSSRKIINMPQAVHGDYVHNVCLDLYFSYKEKNINVLTFANVFFLLEKYHSSTKNVKS